MTLSNHIFAQDPRVVFQFWHDCIRRQRTQSILQVLELSMTVQLLLEPVLNQPCCALWALEAVAAALAQRQRRIATSVEEQQRLLAFRQRLDHRLDQHRREPAAPVRRMLAQVDGRHFRQIDAGEPAGQHDMRVFTGSGVDVGLN